jgi:hypothetical protein
VQPPTNQARKMKKAAKDAIRKKLEFDRDMLKAELRQNIYQMKRLVEKQTLTKRQIAVYQELIRGMDA